MGHSKMQCNTMDLHYECGDTLPVEERTTCTPWEVAKQLDRIETVDGRYESFDENEKEELKELKNGEVIVRDHFGNYYKGNATEMRHRGGDMPRIEAVICDDTHYSTLEGAVNGKGE